MKRSTALLLIELVIMLLVFALAAAICLKTFSDSDKRAQQSIAEDSALLKAQNVAESLKAVNGDINILAADLGETANGKLEILYDQNWNVTDFSPYYRLEAVPQNSDTPLLGEAIITVRDKTNRELIRLTVCWQEVSQ